MIEGIDWNLWIQLALVMGSIIFFIAKLDTTSKSNQAFYNQCIDNLREVIDGKFTALENTMNEKFNGVSERFHGIKHDISRLEHKQEESNRIKERLAIVESHVNEIIMRQHHEQNYDN